MGHHNLAWELTGDSRFRSEHGCVADVLKEIAGLPDDVILSSEDFECTINRTDNFRGFIQALQSQQMDVKLIVYLRNQIDYARSLYFAKLYFGLDQSFPDYLDEIVEHGRFHWRNWTCSFDYEDFLHRLSTIDGVEIIVRSFDEVRRHSMAASHLAHFDLLPADIGLAGDIHENRQQSLRTAVGMFFQWCVRRPPTENEIRLLQALGDAADEKRVRISTASKLKIARRFKDSNEAIYRNYDVPRFDVMEPDAIAANGDDDGPMLETIFSSSLPFFIAGTARHLR